MVQMTWNFQNKLVLTRRFEWWVVESKWEHMFQEAIMMLKFCFISTYLEIGAHLRWHDCEYCGLYWHGDCFQHDLYTDNDFGYLTEQICQLQGSKRRSLFYNKSMLLWSRLDSKKGAIFVTFDGEKWGENRPKQHKMTHVTSHFPHMFQGVRHIESNVHQNIW